MNIIAEILIISLISIIIMVILLKIWPKSGKMGINLGNVKCQNCNNDLPTIRKPKNLRQMLWGGWTCSRCGYEIDKYGKNIYPKKTIEQSRPTGDS